MYKSKKIEYVAKLIKYWITKLAIRVTDGPTHIIELFRLKKLGKEKYNYF